MSTVDVLVEISRRTEGKLAVKGTIVLVHNGVVEALWVPIGAEWVPETRLHDVDAVLALHVLVMGCNGEILGGRCGFRGGKERAASWLAFAINPNFLFTSSRCRRSIRRATVC